MAFNEGLYEATKQLLADRTNNEWLADEIAMIVASDEAGLPNLGRS